MNEKLIKVYFGQDLLPYKDSERSVHFPIVGGAFLGASNTTKIRFYFDRIGDTAATYVSVAKLPNGKQGSQVLSKSSDGDGNYAELELSNWYTQAKGDVYIALQGYSGGVEYSYDVETELYEIHGTPIIQTTGSIKLAINYAPIGDSADYNDEFTTYQEILAGLGDKVDKRETSGLYAYTHDGSVQGEIGVSKLSVADYIVQRDGQQIAVPLTPSANDNATSKKYVDDSIASAVSSVYKYKGSVATYSDLPSSGLTIGDVYNVEETGDNYAWTGTTWDKLAGDIDLSDYATKDYVDTGLSGKQNTLVNQVNIKSINNQSLLGTGNIDIQGGGGGTWGTITGDIQDQTDLQNELSDIREVAEGKCATYVLSYSRTAPTTDAQAQALKKPDGTAFTNLSDFNTYVSGLTLKNSYFNSQDASLIINYAYLIFVDDTVYKLSDLVPLLHKGDIFLISETDVPDRWVSGFSSSTAEYIYVQLDKLETSKIDLTNYATKTDIDNVNKNFAPVYDQLTTTYSVGEVVIYNGKLYCCTTAVTTPEAFDSAKWTAIKVASGFVNLTGTQTITGAKTFINEINFKYQPTSTVIWQIKASGDYSWHLKRDNNFILNFLTTQGLSTDYTFFPMNAGKDLGKSGNSWKDLYLSGTAYFGVNGSISSPLNNHTVITGIVRSDRDDGRDLGMKAYRWKNLWLSGFIGDGNNSTYGLTLPNTTNFTANKEIATTDIFAPTSISLSDGGTITDSTLKTLIQNEQPIKLNGFTCYFSCDDGTNYQYVSTRYDSSANKNHINVITINKSTWVATFHTSDLALS